MPAPELFQALAKVADVRYLDTANIEYVLIYILLQERTVLYFLFWGVGGSKKRKMVSTLLHPNTGPSKCWV